MITINHRLRTVSEFIKPGTLADIGSDHAYLPIYAIQTNLISQAIAGEVIKGPYEAARNNVQEYELSNQIDVRLGDGLEVINRHEHLDNITICGMGGPLIAKILKEGQQKLQSKPRLILQSNIQTQSLRTLLQDINYQIIDERIMEEKGHIYEIVVAEYQSKSCHYTEFELKFGPVLLENKNECFYNKWERELHALEKIKQQLNPDIHQHRYQEIEAEIVMIKEVLKKMKINELMAMLDEHVPFNTAESWDNVGLLIGDESQEVTGILTALDCTLEIVEQAIDKNINTIISHHPLIFKGVQSITNQGYGEIIRLLIQNNINLIAMHTNLDVNPRGVNAMLATKIGLKNTNLINKEPEKYFKVQTFIPESHVETFKQQLNDIGLAKEGNYEYCFFESKGQGQFKPVVDANPYLGEIGEVEYVDEVKLEFMISYSQRQLTEKAIHQYHPYETPVYDFIELSKEGSFGLGIIGELNEPMNIDDFVSYVKSQLQIPSVRYVGCSNTTINKVAMIGGSGIGFEYEASQLGADIFITGDIKHHDALDAKIAGVNLLDINHYSEYVMKEGLKQLLEEWLVEENESNIKILASDINTDPFTYI